LAGPAVQAQLGAASSSVPQPGAAPSPENRLPGVWRSAGFAVTCPVSSISPKPTLGPSARICGAQPAIQVEKRNRRAQTNPQQASNGSNAIRWQPAPSTLMKSPGPSSEILPRRGQAFQRRGGAVFKGGFGYNIYIRVFPFEDLLRRSSHPDPVVPRPSRPSRFLNLPPRYGTVAGLVADVLRPGWSTMPETAPLLRCGGWEED
jgi:hypothetical protein